MLSNTVALLLAAGFGKRLKPLTDIWPKCLMPVHSRPLLDYWLERVYDLGLDKTIVNIHAHENIVKEYLDRPRYKNWVTHSSEKSLQGTAGTLRNNYKSLNSKTVLIIHADNWSSCNLKEFLYFHYNRKNKNFPITMMSFKTNTPETCGILELKKNTVVKMYEKSKNKHGNIANAAIYAIEPEVLDWININPSVTDFSTQVIPKYLGRIYAWENLGIHKDIGTIKTLVGANKDPKIKTKWNNKDNWQKIFESSQIINKLKNC